LAEGLATAAETYRRLTACVERPAACYNITLSYAINIVATYCLTNNKPASATGAWVWRETRVAFICFPPTHAPKGDGTLAGITAGNGNSHLKFGQNFRLTVGTVSLSQQWV